MTHLKILGNWIEYDRIATWCKKNMPPQFTTYHLKKDMFYLLEDLKLQGRGAWPNSTKILTEMEKRGYVEVVGMNRVGKRGYKLYEVIV